MVPQTVLTPALTFRGHRPGGIPRRQTRAPLLRPCCAARERWPQLGEMHKAAR